MREMKTKNMKFYGEMILLHICDIGNYDFVYAFTFYVRSFMRVMIALSAILFMVEHEFMPQGLAHHIGAISEVNKVTMGQLMGASYYMWVLFMLLSFVITLLNKIFCYEQEFETEIVTEPTENGKVNLEIESFLSRSLGQMIMEINSRFVRRSKRMNLSVFMFCHTFFFLWVCSVISITLKYVI